MATQRAAAAPSRSSAGCGRTGPPLRSAQTRTTARCECARHRRVRWRRSSPRLPRPACRTMRVCRCSRPAGSRRRILPAPLPRCRSCWARCSSSPRTGLLAAGCLPAPPRSPSPCSAPAATPASAETSAEVLAACSRDPTAETQPPRLRRDVSRGAWRGLLHRVSLCVAGAARQWAALGEGGQWAPPAPPPSPERTLALLKPDCVASGAAGEVEALIAEHGFEVVRRRRWRMGEGEAAAFLQASCSS